MDIRVIRVSEYWCVSIDGETSEDYTFEYECNARACARELIKRELERW